jgi:hypothetical protein
MWSGQDPSRRKNDMWTSKSNITIKSRPETVWKIWRDVSTWSRWDKGIESSRLLGDFVPGQKLEIKPRKGPKTVAKLLEVRENSAFTDASKFPLATIEFAHTISPDPSGLLVTHTIRIYGPLAFLWSKLVGRKIAADLPESLRELRALAEAMEAGSPSQLKNAEKGSAP